jgi:hypothetical protein
MLDVARPKGLSGNKGAEYELRGAQDARRDDAVLPGVIPGGERSSLGWIGIQIGQVIS